MTSDPSELDSAIARRARETLRGAPKRLEESVLYSLLGPGKRIRPRLVLAVGEGLGLELEIARAIGAAIEMTHAYTLVHDDLPAMDDDDVRRGRPTNHKVYGEAIAILAGDSLALTGPDVLVGLGDRLPPERVLALVAGLLDAAGPRGVIAGQAAEMELGSRAEAAKPLDEADWDALLEIFRLKTGALFRAALTLPAIAAGAEASVVSALGRLGEDVGIAFQIADDLEDDFAARKSDPAHVARYRTADEARAEAERRIERPPGLPTRLAEALAPFLAELRAKVKGGGE